MASGPTAERVECAVWSTCREPKACARLSRCWSRSTKCFLKAPLIIWNDFSVSAVGKSPYHELIPHNVATAKK